MESQSITKEQLRAEVERLKVEGWRLILLSGIDWIVKNKAFEVVYHFAQLEKPGVRALKVVIPESDAHVPSIADIFPLADWHERETYDLFGIVFDGHPNLTRMFLPDDYKGHPLRKDFVAYKRILPG